MYLTRELKSHVMEVSIHWIWIWIWIYHKIGVSRYVIQQVIKRGHILCRTQYDLRTHTEDQPTSNTAR